MKHLDKVECKFPQLEDRMFMVQTRSSERAGHEVLEHVTENLRNVSLAEVPQDVAGFLTLL